MESRINKSEEMNRDIPDSINVKGETVPYEEAANEKNTNSTDE